MNYYFITGASRGIGEGFVKTLLKPENTIFAFSRTPNPELMDISVSRKGNLNWICVDLAKTTELVPIFEKCFESITFSKNDSFTLINNAGSLDPISAIHKKEDIYRIKQIEVNLIAPILLISSFIGILEGFSGKKLIINLSSGAAHHPYAGWSGYCASKSALDMITKVTALEQKEAVNPVLIFSIAPGVVDTDMQIQIRESQEEDFPLRNRFIELKERGYLSDPLETAKEILTIFETEVESYPSGSIIDIRKR
ncbi:SDR family NAD(P)-dependent oxidoreductase [bacterium]|nr:SDR family NAD(P)-dependent oxidoreductase [bacterium]